MVKLVHLPLFHVLVDSRPVFSGFQLESCVYFLLLPFGFVLLAFHDSFPVFVHHAFIDERLQFLASVHQSHAKLVA